MKFSLCNEMYEGWDFARVCEHVAECGYRGIEIAPFTFDEDPSQIDETRATGIGETARAAGLEVVGMHWLLAKPPGMHLTTPDVTVRKRTVSFAQHLARLCAVMGGRIMVWGSPKQRDLVDGDRYEDAFARAAETIREVSEVAGEVGVTLALEPLGPDETSFMVFAEDTVRLIEAVDHPACRLHLDVKAMCQEATPIPALIEGYAHYLAHFHANDSNLRGPGFGQTDFVPIAMALRSVGYEGYVSVEVFDYRPSPRTIAAQSIAYLQQAFRDADAKGE